MRWLMEFYHQRREILARYDAEAPLRAVLLGRSALLVEFHRPRGKVR